MKLGRFGLNLADFAKEVVRQNNLDLGSRTRGMEGKLDVIATSSALDMIVEATPASPNLVVPATTDLDAIIAATSNPRPRNTPPVDTRSAGTVKIVVPNYGMYPLRPLAHAQLAEHCGIHKTYYDRCLAEAPDLLTLNVRHWLQQRGSDARMLRILDGYVRADLSDKYRPLDNLDLLKAVLPPLQASGANIVSCEVTESRMYIKALSKKITFQAKVGDIIEAGILIQNSEVGLGALSVVPFLNRLVCTNGMVCNEFGTRRAHLGKRTGGGDVPSEWLRDETRAVEDAAFFMRVQDTVAAAFDEAKFAKIAETITKSTKRDLDGAQPKQVIEVVRDRFQFTNAEADAMFQHLCSGNDFTQWGVANAATRAAADVESYDRATEIEKLGYNIVALGEPEWMRIVKDAREAAKAAVN